jgi:hypothetical protein
MEGKSEYNEWVVPDGREVEILDVENFESNYHLIAKVWRVLKCHIGERTWKSSLQLNQMRGLYEHYLASCSGCTFIKILMNLRVT